MLAGRSHVHGISKVPGPRRYGRWLAGAVVLCLASGAGITGLVWWNGQAYPSDLPRQAERVLAQLWLVQGASRCAKATAAYQIRVAELRGRYLVERNRLKLWPDPTPWTTAFDELLQDGGDLYEACRGEQATFRQDLTLRVQDESQQLARLRAATTLFDMEPVLPALGRAGVLLKEAGLHVREGRLLRAQDLLDAAEARLDQVETHALQQMKRYAGTVSLASWRRWADEARRWSGRTGGVALVVAKAEQQLLLYRKGRLWNTFSVQLGYNGLQDKLREGDGATPEGRFRILKKKANGQTRFYKALLLNYPTPDHRRRLRQAKARGVVGASE
ncbi:MAG: L,D-transpeptidase family protein, partial [Nitrospirales bacterium]